MTTGSRAEQQLLQRFWQAATIGDADWGRALVLGELVLGVTGSHVIAELLVPTLQQVGNAWQRGEWTVADEHAATAVIDAAAAVIEQNVPEGAVDGPLVVVACAESEWHTLPAKLAAQIARENGLRVRFLGPSIPSSHLQAFLTRLQPEALLLSATMSTALPGAAKSIAAAHAVGVPVVVGGAAFGADDTRARALNADAWLSHAGALTAQSLPDQVQPHGNAELRGEPGLTIWADATSLAADADVLVAAAYSQLFDQMPQLYTLPAGQIAPTRDDLRSIVDALASSMFVDDARILQEFTRWLLPMLRAHGVPQVAVVSAYFAVADQLTGRARSTLLAMSTELAA